MVEFMEKADFFIGEGLLIAGVAVLMIVHVIASRRRLHRGQRGRRQAS